jgi:transposase
MGRRPYSDDLRARVVAAVAEGCSRRAAGKRFAVSASSSIRWVVLHEETGSVRARGGAAVRAVRRWNRMRHGCWSWSPGSPT